MASREERDLQAAFSEKEKAERLLSNLENLRAQGSVTPEQYNQINAGYQNNLSVATSNILQIKSRIAQSIESENTNIELYKHELLNLETRFKVGELKIQDYQRAQQKTQVKIQKMQTKLSDLQRLFNAQSSAEVGGYLDKTKGASRGMGSFHVLEKKTIIGIVAIIGIIGVIAAFLLIPGVKNVVGGQTPEEVIVQFLHHIDNGEYSQAAELVCDQVIVGGSGYRSLDKYSKDFLIQQWELGYGINGKNIKIDNIKVNAINQESEKLYSMQASASVTKGRLILISGIKSEVKTLIENEKFYMTKIDGKWMIVSPHDPFSA